LVDEAALQHFFMPGWLQSASSFSGKLAATKTQKQLVFYFQKVKTNGFVLKSVNLKWEKCFKFNKYN